MGRRAKPYLHGAMNVVSALVLCLAVGRLVYVLRGRDLDNSHQRVPKWMPTPKQEEPRYGHPESGHHHHTVTTDDVLRGVMIPAHEQQQHLRQRPAGEGERERAAELHNKQAVVVESGYRSTTSRRVELPGEAGKDGAWGLGKRVLIFTMDSLQDRVALASKGGPAGEIKIRESLSAALKEAGVEVNSADDMIQQQ